MRSAAGTSGSAAVLSACSTCAWCSPMHLKLWVASVHRWGLRSMYRACLNRGARLLKSMPKPPVRSAITWVRPASGSWPSSRVATCTLYVAVGSEEHCSIDSLGGNTTPRVAAQRGSFWRAVCHPSICSRARGRSTPAGAGLRASALVSASVCWWMKAQVASLISAVGGAAPFIAISS